ncbi:MAG TPA: hypothetical protein VHJ20_01735 [Polyangia bacterium]|nr:hypothetical protein [Polyangia bacterium]
MKGFLALLAFAALGLAGVLWWRHSLEASRAPAVDAASVPAKIGGERRRRHRRGARRLARNEVASAPTSLDDAPPARGVSPTFDEVAQAAATPKDEERVPLAPGGASTTEVPPDDLFGANEPTPPPSRAARQAPEPEPIKLRAADLKIVWQGEDLSRPESTVQRLDFSSDSAAHELTEDEIDARFRAKEDAVLGCIARARPDESTYVPGRVTVRFRILKTGAVKGVQVEAPVILHKGGLLGCVRGVVGGLKFPASGGSQTVSYPFSLT